MNSQGAGEVGPVQAAPQVASFGVALQHYPLLHCLRGGRGPFPLTRVGPPLALLGDPHQEAGVVA